MTSSIDQFAEILQAARSSPVLFVGSGLSRRYLGLDSWKELLVRMADLAGVKYGMIASKSNGNFPAAATQIAQALHSQWWNDPKFAGSVREAGGDAEHSDEFPLKFEMARHIGSAEVGSKIAALPTDLMAEIELLRQCRVDAIITTNWDRLMENMFPDFVTYSTQSDLFDRTPMGVGEIYKIHGCHTRASSLVATKADYDSFVVKNPYLSAKILSLILEHPVVFIGYSMSDSHIQEIVKSVLSCVSAEQLSVLRDNFFVVDWGPEIDEPTMLDGYWMLAEKTPFPIRTIRTNRFDGIFRTIGRLDKPIPARVLRALKDKVYRLVLENDPKSQLQVVDIDDARLAESDVVVGVGTKRSDVGAFGYKGLALDDLIREVLFCREEFDPDQVLLECVPRLVLGARFIPVHYFMKRASAESADSTRLLLIQKEFTDSDLMTNNSISQSKLDLYKSSGKSFRDLASENGLAKMLPYVSSLVKHEAVDDLEMLLRESLESITPTCRSNFRRAVCWVDYLKYATFSGSPAK